jgi:hypothetical protein
METDKFSEALTTQLNGRQICIERDKGKFSYWNLTKYYQHKWKKKDILPTEELIICEIIFCEIVTRSVNIVIEMTIAENSIRYRVVVDRNYCYRRALKKRDIWSTSGTAGYYVKKQECLEEKNGTNGNPSLHSCRNFTSGDVYDYYYYYCCYHVFRR